jgi:hypothetical protein
MMEMGVCSTQEWRGFTSEWQFGLGIEDSRGGTTWLRDERLARRRVEIPQITQG